MPIQISDDSYVLTIFTYFLKAMNKLAVVDSVKCFRVIYKTGVYIFINFQMFLSEDIIAKYAFAGPKSGPETKRCRSYFFVNLNTYVLLNQKYFFD